MYENYQFLFPNLTLTRWSFCSLVLTRKQFSSTSTKLLNFTIEFWLHWSTSISPSLSMSFRSFDPRKFFNLSMNFLLIRNNMIRLWWLFAISNPFILFFRSDPIQLVIVSLSLSVLFVCCAVIKSVSFFSIACWIWFSL